MSTNCLDSPNRLLSTGRISSWLPFPRLAAKPSYRWKDVMDVLSDALRAVRLCGSVFFTAEFSSPWAVNSPNPELLASIVMPEAEHMSLFHILMEGQCLVECGTYTPVTMETGDVVVFPHGHAHTMRSDENARTTRLDHVLSHPSPDALPQVSFGGGGATARLLCGYLNCNQRFAPLFAALPPI